MRQTLSVVLPLFHQQILSLQYSAMNLCCKGLIKCERYLPEMKSMLSRGLGCVSLSYTAQAIVPAESLAALSRTLHGARDLRTTSGHSFVANDVRGGHIISGVEVLRE